MRIFDSLEDFTAAVGSELGTSAWVTITQDQVNLFAQATHDHQWIHVDPERAADGPFGGTIAHGYLTSSLVPSLALNIYRVDGLAMVVNYGSEKLRFPHPVRVGARVRASATLNSMTPTTAGTQARIGFVVEIEGAKKPACITEVIYLLRAA